MIGASRLVENTRLWHLRRQGNGIRFLTGVELDAATVLEPPVRIGRHTRIRESLIGSYTYIGDGSTLLAARVGRFCSGAWGVTLGASAHHLDRATTHTFPWLPIDGGFVDDPGISVEPLYVGHDVWIGCNAVVLSGLRVGDGAAIAAGAVVTSDVPAYAVVAGVPARIVRLRYSEQLVSRLSALLWWEWPDEVLRKNVKLFQAPLDERVIEELEGVAASLKDDRQISARSE
jgi:virginiamycin A acetyltransferase